MKVRRLAAVAAMACGVALSTWGPARAVSEQNVLRSTLPNGLQVVIVRDRLAPVVTSRITYKVGSNDQTYAGQAHALEHMMFRGTKDVSSAQIYEIGQLLGGAYNADTESAATNYFFTVPAQYLDVALRLESDRARGALLNQSGWLAERGAIEQEVTADDSDPFQKLLRRTILPSIFKGTPYANDGLGTRQSFERNINSRSLKAYYDTWYHPNNAVLVIAGDVEPAQALERVRTYFAPIPAGKIPARKPIHLHPLVPATYRVQTDLPYTLAVFSVRTPGWNDKDFEAEQVLSAVLNNQRADLFGLAATGKAFAAGVADVEQDPFASATAIYSVVPTSTKPESAAADLRSVLDAYMKNGVPAKLVDVAKHRAIADAEFSANSIEGLAGQWSNAVAIRGLHSPQDEIAAIQRVTVGDVNRVLRTYFGPAHAIVAYAVPNNSGKVGAGGGQAKENNAIPPSKSEPLPAWAKTAFANVSLPARTISPVSMTLSNGMRLIVQPEHVTHTVVIHGNVETNQGLEASPDKQGVEDILSGLFLYGSANYDRLQLREQLDNIAAEMQAGSDFSLNVLSSDFDRGVQLLADDELHPALPAQAFQIVKTQEVQGLTGEEHAPQHLSDVALAKALYPAGDPATLRATPLTAGTVTMDDIKAYYGKAFRPDVTTAVVIGDVTPEQAKATFEKYFAQWKAVGPKPETALPAVPPNKPADVNVPDPSRVQSSVHLAQVTDLKRSDPEWAQVRLGDALLGGGGSFGTMLMDDLRVRAGLVYYVYSALESHKNRSTFSIGYGSDPNKVTMAQQLALNDIRAVEDGKIDADRLQRSKTMLINEIPLREQSFDGVTNELLGYANQDLPLDQALIDAKRQLDASGQTVQSALKKWIDPSRFVRVILGPAPK